MDRLLGQARRLLKRGDTALARDLLLRHLSGDDRPSPDALNLFGVCEARLGHRELAREAFEEVLSRFPRHAPALNNLGNLALLDGDPHTAREMYTKALRENVLLPEPRFNMVISYQEMGHFEKAMTAYEDYLMIAKTSKWWRLLLLLGLLLLVTLLLRP